MEIQAESLDDVLIELYRRLRTEGKPNAGTRGGTRELIGVTFQIRNPRARLSRSENRGKSFSALGELLWYLSAKNDVEFIKAYVPLYAKDAESDGIIHGGYGPRLFSMRGSINQIDSVCDLLNKRSTSRRAVIQLFNAEDIAAAYKEVPCTTTLQCFQRDGLLHLAATLRSNDAYKGLPHDVFCFTMLQEMIARRLGVEVGEYHQFIGSMHAYDENLDEMARYIDEGFHRVSPMPSMPNGDPFRHVPKLLECEQRMRNGEYFDASHIFNEPYWADVLRLLQAFWASGMPDRLNDIVAKFSDSIYRPYAETRRAMKPKF